MAGVEVQSSPQHVAKNREWLAGLKVWEPRSETLHSGSNETVVYQKGNSRTRKIVGEGMFWGGAVYGLYNLATLDLSGAFIGGAAHIAGRWVRPKEGQ